MQNILWKKFTLGMGLMMLSSTLIAQVQKNPTPAPSVEKQVGNIRIQFDLKRVVLAAPIQGATNPNSSRAYLPVCPPGSNYVSGVNPHLQELDPAPNYPYCNCICNGICGGLTGVTSPGGRQPLYTATVSCSANVQGWFDSSIFNGPGNNNAMLTSISSAPHQFSYCQAGSCTTNPLPANLGYSVPTGGYANTTQIDFMSCEVAIANGCGAPDQSSPGRSAAGQAPQ